MIDFPWGTNTFGSLAIKAFEYTLATASYHEWDNAELKERLMNIFKWCDAKEMESFLQENYPEYIKLFHITIVLK